MWLRTKILDNQNENSKLENSLSNLTTKIVLSGGDQEKARKVIDNVVKWFISPKEFTQWEEMKCGKFRDCTSEVENRDCSGSHIDCALKVDNRDCRGNAFPEVYRPRNCSNMNPFAKLDCKRLKEEERMAYEIRKEVWKKRCELDKAATNSKNAARQAGCEVQKEVWKKQCELDKAVMKADCERLKSSEITGGKAYEVIISSCRQTLLDLQVDPIPLDIKSDLTPFFSSSLLERVRYRVGATNLIWILDDRADVHWNNYLTITFADVIAFKNNSNVNDRSLWVHALTHVEQYDHAATNGFAQLYAYQGDLIEDGAAKKVDWVCRQLQNMPSPPPCNLGEVK